MENVEEKIKAQNIQITDGNTTIDDNRITGDLIPEELTNNVNINVNQDIRVTDETLNAWNNTEAGDATDMETAAGDVTEQATNAGDEAAADGGFDIYVNSGDLNVQIKVEQPISDGITC